MKKFRLIAFNVAFSIVIVMALSRILSSKYISKLSGLDTVSSMQLVVSFGNTLHLAFGLINGRRQRGVIIIDSGKPNDQKADIIVMGLGCIYLFILSQSKKFDWNDFINLYFYLWLFLSQLLLILKRPQFAENGISHAYGLLKWSDIKSWLITTGEKPNLTVNCKTIWSFINNGEWVIPTHNLTPENQEALLQLLKKKMPLCEIRGSSI